jgi:hypothetical protein
MKLVKHSEQTLALTAVLQFVIMATQVPVSVGMKFAAHWPQVGNPLAFKVYLAQFWGKTELPGMTPFRPVR